MSSKTTETLRNEHDRRIRFLNDVRREVGPEENVSDVFSNEQLERIYHEVMRTDDD